MKIRKSQLIKLIKEQISQIDKRQEYFIDFIKGEFHYCANGPSWYSWNNFWKAPITNSESFGFFNSVQAAKKAFLQRYPRDQNYYNWGEHATRLIKNGKPIFGTGNGKLFKK